jgi:hypothetical protein
MKRSNAQQIVAAHGRALTRWPGADLQLATQHGTLVTEDQADTYMDEGTSCYWEARRKEDAYYLGRVRV